MAQNAPFEAAGGNRPTRWLRYLNAGFLWQKRIHRILERAGEPLVPGLPQLGDAMAVWGQSPYATRGEKAAKEAGIPLVGWRMLFCARSIRAVRVSRRLAS